tara:strand:- start:12614 stop:14755 length:2142 start_codon:yes stop_codon:yes gene_type:complete
MKKRIFAIILPFFVVFVHSQQTKRVPLTDAIKYVDFIRQEKYVDALLIIDKYQKMVSLSDDVIEDVKFNDSVTRILVNGKLMDSNELKVHIDSLGSTKVEVQEVLRLNPLVPYLNPKIGLQDYKDSIIGLKIDVPASSNGGNSTYSTGTMVADALARVIAERFKEELTISFIDGFRKKLDEDEDLKKVFPKTLAVLQSQDVFNASLWLTSFRAAMDEDLQKFPERLPDIIETLVKKMDGNFHKSLEFALIKKSYPHIYGIIDEPTNSYFELNGLLDVVKEDTLIKKTNAASMFKLLGILMVELGNDDMDGWAGKAKIERLTRDKEVLKTFFGFILEKHKTVFKGLSITVEGVDSNMYDLMVQNNWGNAMVTILGYVEELGNVIEDILQKVSDLNVAKARNGKLSGKDFLPMLATLDQASKSFFNEDMMVLLMVEKDEVSKILEISEKIMTAVSFAHSIGDRDYAKALVFMLEYLNYFIGEEALNKSVFFTEFLRYTNLGVSLASAETSEELASAINAAALPVQSYRLKRKSPFSITLNAYAGVFYAKEHLTNDNVENDVSDLIGIAAPVGIGFNWALGTRKMDNSYGGAEYINEKIRDNKERYLGRHSLSLFVSIVDVGAIAVYRLNDDQTPLDNIEFQNILAPGAHAIFGFGKTPISLGLGIQYGPELRKVTQGEDILESTLESRGWRYGVSLLVDIPILQIHNRAVRKKKE